MFDIKRALVAVGAGALTGAVAAAKVDITTFRKWLRDEGFGGFWANLKKFDWRIAVGRYFDGAVAGAATVLAGYLGMVQLGVSAIPMGGE